MHLLVADLREGILKTEGNVLRKKFVERSVLYARMV
jgi:hypothetical protein